MTRSVPGRLLTGFAVFLGSSMVLTATATAGERVGSRRQERWHLSWNVVDRGLVSWGAEGPFASADDCLAAKTRAVQRKMDELQSQGNDVTSHDATIIERRQRDQMVLTVVDFSCTKDRDWIILVAQHRLTVVEDRIGPFPTEEQCIETLELEVDFKVKSLQRLGNDVSV